MCKSQYFKNFIYLLLVITLKTFKVTFVYRFNKKNIIFNSKDLNLIILNIFELIGYCVLCNLATS